MKLPSKINVVQFYNGMYAVRVGYFFYEYLDLVTKGYKWSKGDQFFHDCLTLDIEVARRAKRWYENYGNYENKDKYTVIE